MLQLAWMRRPWAWGAVAVLAVGAVLVWRAAKCENTARAPGVIVVPGPVVVVHPAARQTASEEPTDVSSTIDIAPPGTACERRMPGYAKDVSDADTRAIAELVRTWLARTGLPPAIDETRGVLYVQSDEDRGDDPPYPRTADAHSERACGTAAYWLLDSLAARLSHTDLYCCDNVCTYGGMEYAPDGALVFDKRKDRLGDEEWTITAWTETYTHTLDDPIVRKNLADVARMLARERKKTCSR